MEFEGQCKLEGDSFTGWARARGSSQPLWVELFLDDLSLGIALTESDGSFILPIPPAAVDYADNLKIRVANSSFIIPQEAAAPAASDGLLGELFLDRGLTLTGWAMDAQDKSRPVRLHASLDDQEIATSLACERRWRPDNADMHGFGLALPWSLADGQEHEIHVRDELERDLPGSPVRICLVPDNLSALLAKNPAPNKALLDVLRHLESRLPGAVFSENYALWKEAWPVPRPDGKIRCSIATPFLPNSKNLLASQKGLAPGNAQFILLIRPGESLHPHALALMIAALQKAGGAAIYADAEDADGQPLFKPAWDKISFLGRDYLGPVLLAASALRDVKLSPNYGAARVQALLAAKNSGPILHLPQALSRELPVGNDPERMEAVWQALLPINPEARVENEGNAVLDLRFPLAERPRVSIIIPTRDHGAMLKRCVNSLQKTCWDDLEVIIADNGTVEKEALDFLAALEQKPNFRVLRLPGSFNFSWLNNVAAQKATGDLLCFLNNDTEIIDSDWLAKMAEILLAPKLEAGCVGAKLLWPNRLVQHGGVVLGIHQLAGHVGNHWLDDEPGYLFRNRLIQQYSAVTAACMLTPRQLFLDLGGFDERAFSVNFNDVDYCLRLGAMGKKIYWTPHATLLHHESASRGKDENPADKARAQKEMRNLRKKWGCLEDRFYNPNLPLSTVTEPFEGLAFPPRERQFR